MDPLVNKYCSLSPYNYVSNNPLKFVDPNGKEIIVPNINDRTSVLKMINNKALGAFAFDKSGKLYLAKTSGNGSKLSAYYRDKLVSAIDDKQKINISIEQTYTINGKVKDVDKDSGGGVTIKDTKTEIDHITGNKTITKEADVVISGHEYVGLKGTNGNPIKDDSSDILVHELVGHAIPFITNSDTGNAVDNENKVRNQTGEPERAEEPTHLE